MISPQTQPEPSLYRRLRCLIACAAVALSGCQGISGAGLQGTAQVRVIVASPDIPGVDLYAGGTPIAYNLAFGNVTSYVSLVPGAHVVAADATGTRQALTAASISFTGAAQYTVLLGDVSANLQQVVLRDQTTPAPAGQVALRFLDQATAPGPVDVYLVPSGSLIAALSPTLTAQTFGANSGYLNLPAGPYRIVLYPAGATPSTSPIPLHTGSLVNYPSGAARTILLLDQKPPDQRSHASTTPLQLITATDCDPPG